MSDLSRLGKPIELGVSQDYRTGKRSDRYFGGRVPLSWVQRLNAIETRGGSHHVAAWVVWYVAGLKSGGLTVQVRPAALQRCGTNRWTFRRGLTLLEQAGLVRVDRGKGRFPIVTILYAAG